MKKQIWIKVKYDNYYKLINKIMAIISIYDVKKSTNELYLKINYEDYDKLNKYIVSYKFEIISNVGLFRFISIVKKNYLFFISSLIGIILFLIFNNIIIEVEVLHESEEIRNLLYNELELYGIGEYTFKKDYEKISEIKEEILSKYEDILDWIEIETTGMKYTIRVEERIIADLEETNDYCNVYATKDGMVTSINITTGESLVKIGDYVKEGDLLITGDILYNEEVVNEVCASGVVKAQSWYEVSISMPLSYTNTSYTGVTKYNLVYESSNTKTSIFKDRIESYEPVYTTLFSLFGYTLSLEKQLETENIYYTYTEEEALEKIYELASLNLTLKIGEENVIIDQKVLKKTVNDSTIEVDLFIITEEVISSEAR